MPTPAPPMELIFTVVLNCGFCRDAGLRAVLDAFDACDLNTERLNSWNDGRRDIEPAYASLARPQQV